MSKKELQLVGLGLVQLDCVLRKSCIFFLLVLEAVVVLTSVLG